MRNGTWGWAAALLLAGCGKPAPLAVENAWVRLPAVDARPGAAYFTLRGGAADTTLIAARVAGAERSELHDSMAMGPMTTMHPLASVPVAAGATVAFAPGGNHVMLFGLAPRLQPGGTTTLTLEFADGRRLRADAKVMGAVDPAP